MIRVGIDIGGTKLRVGLTDEAGRLLIDKKLKTAQITDFCASIRDTLDELCGAMHLDTADILSVGMGVPGTISADGRKILKVPNIEFLSETLADDLQRVLGIPVWLMQDSRAAAWGEYLCGNGKNDRCMICISLGTGLGTGIVIDGKVWHGALGCAGELGHLPAVPGGRPCGCGKIGCLEKYAAGRGLDITAAELLGEGKSAPDLFAAAEAGDPQAKAALNDAVQMLGGAVCAAINLLSPNRIVFSGGLSEQETLYLHPLIDYVKAHCYSSGTLPVLEKAALGEDSPLIGAALIPLAYEASSGVCPKRSAVRLSASIMCADAQNYGKVIAEIAAAGIDYLHCDIMDNQFVPNLMLPPELLNRLRDASPLPFDYHIMAVRPESIVERLDLRPGDLVAVHAESTPHLEKVIAAIREKGGEAAVAINPATPIETIREVLPELSMVLVMTVNPGFAGQKLVPGALDKIRRMRKFLDENGYPELPIEVDGNCSFENVPKMRDAGAEIFVVGTSSVFSKETTIAEGTRRLLDSLK